MQYLRNAQSDFDPVFFYLFVFSSSVTYVKTEKMVFTPPPPLALIYRQLLFLARIESTTFPPCLGNLNNLENNFMSKSILVNHYSMIITY